MVDPELVAVGATTLLSGLVTVWAAFGLTALSTRLYWWLISDDYEMLIPSFGFAYPLVVFSASTVGLLVGVGLRLAPAWIILLGVVAAVVFYVLHSDGPNVHLLAFKLSFCDAFPLEEQVPLFRWATTLLLVGMGFIAARGILRVLPDSLTGILVGISGAAVLGVLLLILLYYPFARSERRWFDDAYQTGMPSDSTGSIAESLPDSEEDSDWAGA